MASFIDMRAYLMPQPTSTPTERNVEKSYLSILTEKVSSLFESLYLAFRCCGSNEAPLIFSDLDTITMNPISKDRSANRTISIHEHQVSSLREEIQQHARTINPEMPKPDFIALMIKTYPNVNKDEIFEACSVITPGNETL